MGNKATAPTKYLDGLWAPDEEHKLCYNCRKEFTFTRRRHHCRCCGLIFCNECWGERVQLPVEYGFPEPEAVCYICIEMFSGKLKGLREQRCVAVTQSLKSRAGTAQPPLSAQNISDRNFRIFYVKVAQWRPFNDKTNLQFATKPERKNPLLGSPTASTSASLSTTVATSSSGGSVPKCSRLDASDMANVAFTIPLDTITHVVFDLHKEGDFVTLETAQEYYRLQCVDMVEVPMQVSSPTTESNESAALNANNDAMSTRSGETGRSSITRRRSVTFKVSADSTSAFYEQVLDAVNASHSRADSHRAAAACVGNASTRSGGAPDNDNSSRGSMCSNASTVTLGTRASYLTRRPSHLGKKAGKR